MTRKTGNGHNAKTDTARPQQMAGHVIELQPDDITVLARIEQVPEARVKAAMQAFGNDRAKVVGALRAGKAQLH